MDPTVAPSIFDSYQVWLSILALVGVYAAVVVGKDLLVRAPALKGVYDINQEAAAERMSRSYYKPVQDKSKLYGLGTMLAIFLGIIPFVITAESQSLWQILWDVFVILMVYDFFYYLVHRYLFHDGPLGGPLIWVHAVHHQAMNPCRLDSNYLNPIETCMGLALYGACIGVLGLIMGDFHVITIIVTWTAFSQINQHNHDLMDVPHFPFKYINFMSAAHHVHHKRFTSGNFATITMLYDWMFGTYDAGDGYKKPPQESAATKEAIAMGEAAVAAEAAAETTKKVDEAAEVVEEAEDTKKD